MALLVTPELYQTSFPELVSPKYHDRDITKKRYEVAHDVHVKSQDN